MLESKHILELNGSGLDATFDKMIKEYLCSDESSWAVVCLILVEEAVLGLQLITAVPYSWSVVVSAF